MIKGFLWCSHTFAQDPENRGRNLFAAHCAVVTGIMVMMVVDTQWTIDNLHLNWSFASVDWITKLLTHEHYISEEYF